ncbi:MAG TPA: c-type cytochrome [Thermoanaerobaculia bacterium]|nr:c-type cytochrome [Thermoanaerobaculia bacterium]
MTATAFAVLVLGCAAVGQQKTQPPRADDLHFHNLQVLPQNITRDDLLTTMRRFKQALGVECSYCHAAKPGDPTELDFRSDAKQHKAAARTMLRMLNTINHDYIAHVEDVYTTASCWTCHRGKTQPDIAPSLPPPQPDEPHPH